ncbi:UDP-glycosyltransferase 86a1 [Phtheirospermum japonicum]|uniref:Glycosyltransferase n=1 Tax=Phtheirospermum japonicum TaxID=374723 RepID=A0A830BDJ4_9LAMI|nr:UDP-glycosyltransferase 86a1 [Phtheirospermum japonicum]
MGENQNLKNLHHIIIIPPPFQGHINPSIQLTLQLASKGFIVTFINTQATHHQITKSKSREGNDDVFAGSGLDIRYRTISDGFPLSFDRSLHREQFMMGRIHVYPAHVDEIVGQLVGLDPRPTCLVADTFSTWGDDVARRYGLVFVSLWTQPALVLSVYCHVDLLKKNGHYGSKNNRKDTIDYIPGVKPLDPQDLVSYLQETDTSTAMHQVIHKAFSDVKKADFIICNTVEELEPESISSLKEIRPTYPIGPLFPSHFTSPSVEMSLWSESNCNRWLDNKPHGSVLYASFGSYARINIEDIEAIANGLLLSGVNFIWVLRPDIVSSEVTEVLPDGFRESVGNKGLVVPWCKQNAVLSHPSVGGFLTHCGWNSILESVWVGVPLICFPLVGDQITNRKVVVDDWKIGINLCEGKNVSCNEVAERIKLLMSGGTSDELRKNIGRVKKLSKNALSSIGSSRISFDKFVEDVKAKIENYHSVKK